VLHLLSEGETKSVQAENTVAAGGIVSVQVLNEFVSVARRKLNMSFAEIREFLSHICMICPVIPVTVKVHDQGLRVADSMDFRYMMHLSSPQHYRLVAQRFIWKACRKAR
jgi:predicted nucleic acid-binding protein